MVRTFDVTTMTLTYQNLGNLVHKFNLSAKLIALILIISHILLNIAQMIVSETTQF